MNQSKYLPNLTSLRFIAAILVLIHHIEQLKYIFNIPNLWENNIVRSLGPLSVYFFFVLSGYLICHLMLIEEKKYNKINIQSFYFRRIIKVWPLYFLIIILALHIIPKFSFFEITNLNYECLNLNSTKINLLYFSFLPQIALLTCIIPFAAHTWSLGAEEQFYLIWPHLFNISKKNRLIIVILITILWSLIGIITDKFSYFNNTILYILKIWLNTPLQCMLIGCLGALFSYNYKDIIDNYIKNLYFEMLTIIIIFTLIIVKGEYIIAFFSTQIYSILFVLLIINASTNTNSVIKLEKKLLIDCGKLTYGIYMYHPFVIILCLKIMDFYKINNNFILYSASIILTGVIAYISFHYFESYFLKLKPNDPIQ